MDNRKTLFLFLFLVVFLFWSSGAKASVRELSRKHGTETSSRLSSFVIAQKIEILKFELSLLQSLLLNMQQKQPIKAPSYIAVKLSDNSVQLGKNQNKTYPIASVTKLMTAVIALENVMQDQKITLTEEMLKPLGQSPSLYLGLTVNAENLLKTSLIQSANDAAESLTHFIGKQRFIQLMNQKAKDLQMTNTIFYDAHGLSLANRSSAADLAKLLAYIYKNRPEILTTTKNNDFWLPDKNKTMLKFQNTNNFYPLSDFIGGKTGYLPQARQTFAGVFSVKGEPIALVVLYSDNRQADVFAILWQLKN